MRRRDIAKALALSSGSVVLSREVAAQACTPPCYPVTTAETAASVTPTNYTYPPGNLLRYGADPTGVAVSDSAMVQALAVVAANAQNGGKIYLPANPDKPSTANYYLFNNPWILNQLSGVTIYGDGGATGGAGPATKVVYAGTGTAHFIQMTSAAGCKIQQMQLVNSSNSFTGALIRCGNDGTHGDSALCAVEDVTFIATSSSYHLDLDKCIEFTARRCNFANGAVSVFGQHVNSYSNVIKFYECQWTNCAATPVNYGGESWLFDTCTFEPLSNGRASAFGSLATTPCVGLTFINCWFGDANVAGGTWVTVFGAGFTFTGGNYVSTVNPTGVSYGISLFGVNGFTITGNAFVGIYGAINFGPSNGTSGSNCRGGVIQANAFDNVTDILISPIYADTSTVINPNSPLLPGYGRFYSYGSTGTPGWEYGPNGLLDLWGATSVTSGTPVAVAFSALGIPGFSFSMASPPQLGIVPGAAGNVSYIVPGTIGLGGFSLNCTGSGVNTVYWRCKGY